MISAPLASVPEDASKTDVGSSPGGEHVDGFRERTAPVAAASGCSTPTRRATLIVALAVAIARFLFTIEVRTFAMSPDELANAGMARFLAGGDWNMLRTNTWRPGYATLLAPMTAVVDDQTWWIRCAFAINAIIAGATLFILVPLVSRLTRLSAKHALIVAGVVATTPASLSASGHVWAEPMVTLTFLGCLWSAMRFFDARRLRHAIGAVAWAVLGYTCHGRMLPVVAIAVVGATVALLGQRRLMHAAAVVGFGSVTVLASNQYADWIFGELWTATGSTNTSEGVIERLRSPLQVLDSVFGQLWYQLTASALVFGIGMAALVLAARRRSEVDTTARRDARVILSFVVPMLAMSATFMSDRARADHVIYGRYNDAIAWPVLAIGLAWLASYRHAYSRKVQTWVLVVVPVFYIDVALVLRQLHYKQLEAGTVVIDMVAGLMPIIDGSGEVRVFTLSAASLMTFGVGLALLLRVRPSTRVFEASLVAGLIVAGLLAYANFPSRSNRWEAAVAAAPAFRATVPAGETIGVSLMPDDFGPDASIFVQTSYALFYEWYLPEYEFAVDDGLRDEVGPYVVGATNDLILSYGKGEFLWKQPDRELGLWKEPEILDDGTRNPSYASP